MITTVKAYCLACMVLLCSYHWCTAQSFDYSFASSSGTYQSLAAGTPLGNGTSDWSNSRFQIPVGFTFQFAGASFDTLTIEPQGFVKFDAQRAVVLFHGISCKKDSNDVYSQLSYELSGQAGSKVLKIQYSYCGYDKSNPGEYLNYQLWLHEQGKVEIHTGATSYLAVADSAGTDSLGVDSLDAGITPLVGLINPMQDWNTNALLITGNPASPVSQPVNAGSELVYLECVPAAGRKYTFTPNGN